MPPTRKTYRRITAQDSSTTLPNRTTFPVGTFTQSPPIPRSQQGPSTFFGGGSQSVMYANTGMASNPATAVAGQLGAPSGMLPARVPYPGYNQKPKAVSPANSFGGWTAQNAAAMSQAQQSQNQGQYLGQGTYLPNGQVASRPSIPPGGTTSFLSGGDFNLQNQVTMLMRSMDEGGKMPAVPISAAQMQGLLAAGMDPALVSSTYDKDPNTGEYVPKGWDANTGQVNVFDPTKPFGGFQNTGGADNTDFTKTAVAQYNAAAGISYENQLRWDPKTGSFMKIGALIARDNGAGGLGFSQPLPKGVKLNKYGQVKKPRRDRGGESVTQPVSQPVSQPAPRPVGTGGASTSGSFGVSTG